MRSDIHGGMELHELKKKNRFNGFKFHSPRDFLLGFYSDTFERDVVQKLKLSLFLLHNWYPVLPLKLE